jgi:short-subunit dehydrogenase
MEQNGKYALVTGGSGGIGLPGSTDTDFFNKAGMQESKVVQAGQLADPSEVAKDGYKALISGDDMVVSGFKNKVQVGMSNILPDSTVASSKKPHGTGP